MIAEAGLLVESDIYHEKLQTIVTNCRETQASIAVSVGEREFAQRVEQEMLGQADDEEEDEENDADDDMADNEEDYPQSE